MTIGGPYDNVWPFLNSAAPADPVPFSTDACRCPACTHATQSYLASMPPIQAITDAPALIQWDEITAEQVERIDGIVRSEFESGTWQTIESETTLRRIIAFTGLAGSGKSTAAAQLVNVHGWQRLRFAGPLKAMMAALGLSEREIDGDLKEQPCALLGGRTPRYAMQTIGTEWGRDLIMPDLWIRAWRHALAQVPVSVNIVVDDCRFPNEAEAVRAAGGVIVRVERKGAGQGAAGHSSEGYRVDAGPVVTNDGSVQDFLCTVDDLVTPHGG